MHQEFTNTCTWQEAHLQMASELLGSWEYPHGINSNQKHAGVSNALLFNPLNPGLPWDGQAAFRGPSQERYLQSHPWGSQRSWCWFCRWAPSSRGRRCTWCRWCSCHGRCTSPHTGDQCTRCQWPRSQAGTQQGKILGTTWTSPAWKWHKVYLF